MQRYSLNAALLLLLAVPIGAAAQSTGTSSSSSSDASGGASSTVGSSTNSSQMGASSTSGSQSGSSGAATRDPQDDITAVAPPFNVDDVLRMHRVGLQDEVIINALRARYHPFKLTHSEREELERNSVSEAVIDAIEDPLGEGAASHAAPPFVPSAGHAVKPAAKPETAATPPAPATASASAIATSTASLHAAPTSVKVSPDSMVDYTRTANLKTPDVPGVYRRINGGGWAPVATESIMWKHNPHDPARGVKGQLAGKACGTATTAAAADFLIVVKPGISIAQVQLLHVRADHDGRDFTPTADGEGFGGADNSEAVRYDPQKLGSKVWLVSLHNLPAGDYGFLPPNQSELRSTTGYAQAIYTFHVL